MKRFIDWFFVVIFLVSFQASILRTMPLNFEYRDNVLLFIGWACCIFFVQAIKKLNKK